MRISAYENVIRRILCNVEVIDSLMFKRPFVPSFPSQAIQQSVNLINLIALANLHHLMTCTYLHETARNSFEGPPCIKGESWLGSQPRPATDLPTPNCQMGFVSCFQCQELYTGCGRTQMKFSPSHPLLSSIKLVGTSQPAASWVNKWPLLCCDKLG